MFIDDLQQHPACEGPLLFFAEHLHFRGIMGFEARVQMVQERVAVEVSNILRGESQVDAILVQ